jgi:hypothetical protein
LINECIFNTNLIKMKGDFLVPATFRYVNLTIRNSAFASKAEASEDIIPNIPEAWKVAQGERNAFAVPESFLVSDGSNTTLFTAVMQTVLGDAGSEDINTVLNQMNIDLIAGGLTGENIFLIAATYSEGAFPTDLETAVDMSRGLIELSISDSLEVELGENQNRTLPAGDALLVEGRVQRADAPTLQAYSFVLPRKRRKAPKFSCGRNIRRKNACKWVIWSI